MASALPFIVAGVALFAYTRGKKKGKKEGQKKALPAPKEDFGDVFLIGQVDKIGANVGERFSIDLPSPGANAGYVWNVSATPPGDPIKHVSHTSVSEQQMGGAVERHTFDAKKKGSGSIVFHYERGWEKGQAHPQEIAEIQVEVS